MTVALCITHAPWIPERVQSVARMKRDLYLQTHSEIPYYEETTRGPFWLWSELQWEWGARQEVDHIVYLQDDVFVPKGFFWGILGAMLANVPDQIIGLDTCHPSARKAAREGVRWVTTADGLVGPGYVLPRPILREFLQWRQEKLDPIGRERITEDSMIDVFAVDTGRRIWHPVPTIIDHDIEIKSSYGNDAHLYRRPSVTWHDGDVGGWGGVESLVDADFWKPTAQHLGRFYRFTHWAAKRWVKGFTQEAFDRVDKDVCPEPWGRFFVYP